jgi:hypothetical protein
MIVSCFKQVMRHTWIGCRVQITRSNGSKVNCDPLGACCHGGGCEAGRLTIADHKLYVKVCWGREEDYCTKDVLVDGLLLVDGGTPPTLAMLPCVVDPRAVNHCRLALERVGVGFEPCAPTMCNDHCVKRNTIVRNAKLLCDSQFVYD